MHDLPGEFQSYLDAYFVTAVIPFSLHVTGPEWEALAGAYLANRPRVLCFVASALSSLVASLKLYLQMAELSFAYLWGRPGKGPEGAEYWPGLSAVALSGIGSGVRAERRAGLDYLGLA